MTLSPVVRRLAPVFALAALIPTSSPLASAAAIWAGADLRTSGYGVRAGVALLPVPFLGTFGVEGGAERPYQSVLATPTRPPSAPP